jgi:hypothetical protein
LNDALVARRDEGAAAVNAGDKQLQLNLSGDLILLTFAAEPKLGS